MGGGRQAEISRGRGIIGWEPVGEESSFGVCGLMLMMAKTKSRGGLNADLLRRGGTIFSGTGSRRRCKERKTLALCDRWQHSGERQAPFYA